MAAHYCYQGCNWTLAFDFICRNKVQRSNIFGAIQHLKSPPVKRLRNIQHKKNATH